MAIAVGLIAAGCGGGSGAVTAANTPKQLAADKAVAKHAVLRLSDLPAGYKGTPHEESSSDDIPPAVLAKFATCLKAPKAEISRLLNNQHDASQPSVDSPDFDSGGTLAETSFQNSVEIDRSSDDISKPVALFAGNGKLACWKDLFQAAFEQTAPSGGSVQGLKVVSLPTGSVGDESAAFEASVTITQSGITIPAYLDFYFVGRGRAGITLFASGINHRVDGALERSLVKTVADRLDAAT